MFNKFFKSKKKKKENEWILQSKKDHFKINGSLGEITDALSNIFCSINQNEGSEILMSIILTAFKAGVNSTAIEKNKLIEAYEEAKRKEAAST